MSEDQTLLMLYYFVIDLPAPEIAYRSGLNKKTVKLQLKKVRERILKQLNKNDEEFLDKIRLSAEILLSSKLDEKLSLQKLREPRLLIITYEKNQLLSSFTDFITVSTDQDLKDLSDHLDALKNKQRLIHDFAISDEHQKFKIHQQILLPFSCWNFLSFAKNRLNKFYGVQAKNPDLTIKNLLYHYKETQWRFNGLSAWDRGDIDNDFRLPRNAIPANVNHRLIYMYDDPDGKGEQFSTSAKTILRVRTRNRRKLQLTQHILEKRTQNAGLSELYEELYKIIENNPL